MEIVTPYARMLPLVPFDLTGEVDEFQLDKWLEGKFTPQMGRRALQKVEWCARVSHRSEDKMTLSSWERFLKNVVLEKGDWSVTEHVEISVDSITDRGITHEWVRHRLASYTQESTRFVNYEKKMPPKFIYPQVDINCPHCLAGDEVRWLDKYEYVHTSLGPPVTVDKCLYSPSWLEAITIAEEEYCNLIKEGWRPQEARSVFPNALASRVITTMNLRAWRHVFLMRTTIEAHPQYRQVSIPLLAEFKRNIPLLFDDIEPNARQSENIKKGG